jgi:hypothetical protein
MNQQQTSMVRNQRRASKPQVESVEVYKGFNINFIFPHYYVYYNKTNVWTDISPKDCKVWIDGLLEWCNEATP